MVADIVKNIAGNKADVTNSIGSWADPHERKIPRLFAGKKNG